LWLWRFSLMQAGCDDDDDGGGGQFPTDHRLRASSSAVAATTRRLARAPDPSPYCCRRGQTTHSRCVPFFDQESKQMARNAINCFVMRSRLHQYGYRQKHITGTTSMLRRRRAAAVAASTTRTGDNRQQRSGNLHHSMAYVLHNRKFLLLSILNIHEAACGWMESAAMSI